MYVFPTPSEGVNFILRIRAAALRTAILPVFHLRTPSKGVPQMYVFPTPSEGVKGGTKMRGNGSPLEGGRGVVEGEMLLQAVLVAVVFLRTFGRWDENAGKLLTFGRWERCGVWENAAAGGSRCGDGSAHLWKVGRKSGEMTHLRKVGRGESVRCG